MRRFWLFLCAGLFATGAAAETLQVCYGYGCLAQATILYGESRLHEIDGLLRGAQDAAGERELLAQAVGRLYAWAGEQSDIRNDRGGNYADGTTPGKMDCIDHSTSTTRLLKMLEARGDLRWHRVLAPELRYFALVFPAHWSATIEENEGGARYVVDSWFVNNGEPAVILPLEEWKKGAGPDV